MEMEKRIFESSNADNDRHKQMMVGLGNRLLDHLRFLWEQNLLLDVVITQNGAVISKAHKIVIGAFSTYLYSLLNEQNYANENSSIPIQEIQVDNCSKENVCLLVKFLYTGAIDKTILANPERLVCLKDNAVKLQFQNVVDYIEYYQKQKILTDLLSGTNEITTNSCVNEHHSNSQTNRHGVVDGAVKEANPNELTFCIEYSKDSDDFSAEDLHDTSEESILFKKSKSSKDNDSDTEEHKRSNETFCQTDVTLLKSFGLSEEIVYSNSVGLVNSNKVPVVLLKDLCTKVKNIDEKRLISNKEESLKIKSNLGIKSSQMKPTVNIDSKEEVITEQVDRTLRTKRKRGRPRRLENFVNNPKTKKKKTTSDKQGLKIKISIPKIKKEVAENTDNEKSVGVEEPSYCDTTEENLIVTSVLSMDSIVDEDLVEHTQADVEGDDGVKFELEESNEENTKLNQIVELDVAFQGESLSTIETDEIHQEQQNDELSDDLEDTVHTSKNKKSKKGRKKKIPRPDDLVNPKVRKKRNSVLATSKHKQTDGKYKCPECKDKVFTEIAKFRKHYMSKHVTDKPYKCTYCDKGFLDNFKLNEHIRVHTGERPFKCEVCQSAFKAKKHLNKHMTLHNREARQVCDYEDCSQSFADKDQLRRHIRSVHLKLKPFKCEYPTCDYSASDNAVLKSHMQKHLPLEERSTQLCNICGTSVPGGKTNLRVHMIKHSSELHSCPICDYKTKYKLYLKSHITRRHGIDSMGKAVEKPFKCPHCDFSCYFKHEYTFHAKKHDTHKPFKCKVCEYACLTQSQLNSHMRIHTGSKPYNCETCGKSFTQSTHLSRHTRIHTGDRPHKCNQCGQGFIEKRYLERHMYSQHLNIKPYMCHLCIYSCIKRDTLKNHIRSAHGESALPEDMCTVTKKKILVKDLSFEKQVELFGEEAEDILRTERIRRYEPRHSKRQTKEEVNNQIQLVTENTDSIQVETGCNNFDNIDSYQTENNVYTEVVPFSTSGYSAQNPPQVGTTYNANPVADTIAGTTIANEPFATINTADAQFSLSGLQSQHYVFTPQSYISVNMSKTGELQMGAGSVLQPVSNLDTGEFFQMKLQ